jgi:hypothetical protein
LADLLPEAPETDLAPLPATEEGDATDVAAPANYSNLSKPEVIAIATDRGIDVSGTKAEIIARLEAADATH